MPLDALEMDAGQRRRRKRRR